MKLRSFKKQKNILNGISAVTFGLFAFTNCVATQSEWKYTIVQSETALKNATEKPTASVPDIIGNANIDGKDISVKFGLYKKDVNADNISEPFSDEIPESEMFNIVAISSTTWNKFDTIRAWGGNASVNTLVDQDGTIFVTVPTEAIPFNIGEIIINKTPVPYSVAASYWDGKYHLNNYTFTITLVERNSARNEEIPVAQMEALIATIKKTQPHLKWYNLLGFDDCAPGRYKLAQDPHIWKPLMSRLFPNVELPNKENVAKWVYNLSDMELSDASIEIMSEFGYFTGTEKQRNAIKFNAINTQRQGAYNRWIPKKEDVIDIFNVRWGWKDITPEETIQVAIYLSDRRAKEDPVFAEKWDVIRAKYDIRNLQSVVGTAE